MKIFVFDTETGGLDMRVCSLLEVGWVVGDLETEEILDTGEALVKLPRREDYHVTQEAFDVHKITVEECMRDGLPPEQIGEMMIDSFVNHGCQLYAGHNVNIDVDGCSRHLFKMDPADWPSTFTYRKIDSHDFIRLMLGVEGMKSGASLAQIAKTLGLKLKSSINSRYHRALADADMTWQVLCHFRKVFKDERFIEIAKNPQ